MIDLKNINKERIEKSCKSRGISIDINKIFDKYNNLKHLQQQLEQLYSIKNTITYKCDEAEQTKQSIKILESEIKTTNKDFLLNLSSIPNVIDDSVPDGIDGKIIKQHGEIIFKQHHYDMNSYQTSPINGARFVILSDKFAALERALGQFMINTVIAHGFQEYSIPYIIKPEFLNHTGHLPKDKDNMFYIDDDYYLIPTSEVSLVSLNVGKKITETVKIASLTDCFRREAGSAGRDTKGLIRLHQFKKCEMVCITDPKKSYGVLEEMLEMSIHLLKLLEIPYRVRLLGAQDMGFTSSKTYDIEIPIGNKWREVSSISNCETFQSSSLNIKCGDLFAHTLNGSALAVGRTLASLIEINYDEQTNSISIPKCLHKYIEFKHIQL